MSPKVRKVETEPIEPRTIHWRHRTPGSGDVGNMEPVIIVKAKEPTPDPPPQEET